MLDDCMFAEVNDNFVEDKQEKKIIKKSAPVNLQKVEMLKKKIACDEIGIIGSEQDKLASAERILNKLLEIDNKLPG